MPKAEISSTPKTRKSAKPKGPTNEEIALRAYHIYLERKGAPGDQHGDWLRAERELLAENSKKTKARSKSSKSKVTSIAA
jgi:Protein of unknown function (DUF2934)